jgi:phosphoglycerate kinase
MEAVEIYERIAPLSALELEGKRIFLRVDFNVGLTLEGKIADDSRLRAALDTVNYIVQRGGKVALGSHLGRPHGKVDPALSLLPVAEAVAEIYEREVIFSDDCVGDGVRKMMAELKSETLLLLENLRFHRGEEENGEHFCRKLAENFDVYVGDAFASAHRPHGSLVGALPHFREKAGGLLLQREVRHLLPLMVKPKQPYIVVLGGARVSDKIAVIENLMSRCKALCIGGGMAYTFLKAQGVEVGTSLVEESKLVAAERMLRSAKKLGIKVHLPLDHKVAGGDGTVAEVVDGRALPRGRKGLDIGPKTANLFADEIRRAATVFWNGPPGRTELPAFVSGSEAVALALAECRGVAVAGGGDTFGLVRRFGLGDKIQHVSTGGGATLEFLEGRLLPALAALAA